MQCDPWAQYSVHQFFGQYNFLTVIELLQEVNAANTSILVTSYEIWIWWNNETSGKHF